MAAKTLDEVRTALNELQITDNGNQRDKALRTLDFLKHVCDTKITEMEKALVSRDKLSQSAKKKAKFGPVISEIVSIKRIFTVNAGSDDSASLQCILDNAVADAFKGTSFFVKSLQQLVLQVTKQTVANSEFGPMSSKLTMVYIREDGQVARIDVMMYRYNFGCTGIVHKYGDNFKYGDVLAHSIVESILLKESVTRKSLIGLITKNLLKVEDDMLLSRMVEEYIRQLHKFYAIKGSSVEESQRLLSDFIEQFGGDFMVETRIAFKSLSSRKTISVERGLNIKSSAVFPGVQTSRFFIKTWRNEYLSARNDGTILGNIRKADKWEKFECVNMEGGRIAIYSPIHQKYLCVEPSGRVTMDRNVAKTWETFTVERHGNRFALRSHHGTYLSATERGIMKAVGWVDEWEMFRVVSTAYSTYTATTSTLMTLYANCLPTNPASRFSIKTWHGLYLSAREDGSVTCDVTKTDAWEQFKVEFIGDRVALYSPTHGRYLCAEASGAVTFDRVWIREWELFKLERVDDTGKFALRTHHGTYLSATDGGKMMTVGHLKEWETFTIDNVFECEERTVIDKGAKGHLMIGKITIPKRELDFYLNVSPEPEPFPMDNHRPSPGTTMHGGTGGASYQYGSSFTSSSVSPSQYPSRHPHYENREEQIRLQQEQRREALLAILKNITQSNVCFSIKTWRNEYFSARNDGSVCANVGVADKWEQFICVHLGDNRVAIYSPAHKKYLCVTPSGAVSFDRDVADSWETFTIEAISRNQFALRSFHGTYLSATDYGALTTVTHLKHWEVFTLDNVVTHQWTNTTTTTTTTSKENVMVHDNGYTSGTTTTTTGGGFISGHLTKDIPRVHTTEEHITIHHQPGGVVTMDGGPSPFGGMETGSSTTTTTTTTGGSREVFLGGGGGATMGTTTTGGISGGFVSGHLTKDIPRVHTTEGHITIHQQPGGVVTMDGGHPPFGGMDTESSTTTTTTTTGGSREVFLGGGGGDTMGTSTSTTTGGGATYEYHQDTSSSSRDYITSTSDEFVPSPTMDYFYMKSSSNEYLSARDNGTITCNVKNAGAWERFSCIAYGDRIALFSNAFQLFLTAHPDGRLTFEKQSASILEMFSIDRMGERFALRSAHGTYLSVNADGSVGLINRIHETELFTLQVGSSSSPMVSPHATAKGMMTCGPEGVIDDSAVYTIFPSLGVRFHVKTCRNEYLSARSNGGILCNANLPDLREQFLWVSVDDGIALYSPTYKKYLCAEPSGRVVIDRVRPSRWETFTAIRIGDGFSLRTHHGTYLSVSRNNTLCTSKAVGIQETFHVEISDIQSTYFTTELIASALNTAFPLQPSRFHIKTCRGEYLVANPDGEISSSVKKPATWGQFECVTMGDQIAIYCPEHKKYLSMSPSGRVTIDKPWMRSWERFTVCKIGHNKFALRSHHGTFLSAVIPGKVTSSSRIRDWELFHLGKNTINFQYRAATTTTSIKQSEVFTNEAELTPTYTSAGVEAP